MKTQTASAVRIINAPAGLVYKLIADYRNTHPLILPKPYFLSLDVEEGGFGEGTIIRFQMRILGQTRSFQALITEPEPGCVLQETDLGTNISTTFTVLSLGHKNHAKVTIMTVLKDRGLIGGFLARLMLQKIYAQELTLLAGLAEMVSQPMQASSENKTLSISSQ